MASVSTGSRPGARERILAAAAELFYANGFAAVGIDRIIAEAGVAKASLYHHFATKDDLVVAYLEDTNRAFWSWIDGDVDASASARDQLVQIFGLIEGQATNPGCRGCTFQVTAAEFPEASHPAHAVAAAHKLQALARFTALAQEAELRHPEALAAALLLLMDGAWAATRMFGSENHSRGLTAVAESLIDGHALER